MTKRTGDARFPSTKYKTSQHCVAYLDFLGGKNIIYNDNGSEHLNKINMIYSDARRKSKIYSEDIFIKIFSDNILFAIPTDHENREGSVEDLIVLVSAFVQEATEYGYLIRGAITEGDFFGDTIFSYGKALVEAVEMEEKYAVYPRVIVKKEIATLLPHYFYKCADGWDSVNYYILGGGFDSVNFRGTLLNQLATNKHDIKVRQKIMFAIADFNTISKFKRKMGSVDCEPITFKEIERALK